MYISGQFFYGFKLLDMSGQISYDFDEKLLNFNNSHQTGVLVLNNRWRGERSIFFKRKKLVCNIAFKI